MKPFALVAGIVAIVAAIFWYQVRRANATPYVSNVRDFNAPTPTVGDEPTLNKIVGGVRTALGIGTTATGLVASVGGAGTTAAAISGAAVPAAFAAVPAEIGISSAAAAALPGAVAIEAAPAVASVPATGASASAIGTAGALSQLASTALVLGGVYAILRYTNQCPEDQICGGGGFSYFKDGPCDPASANYDAAACARGTAGTGAESFVLDSEGNKILTYGNVNLTTEAEAIDAGFGGGGY